MLTVADETTSRGFTKHEPREVRVERARFGRDREECHRVADRRIDLGAVPDDPGIVHQACAVVRVERRHDDGVETPERRPERSSM